MLVFLFLASGLLPHVPRQPAVYDFYFHSVKKGSCTVFREGDRLISDSRPGFAPDSRIEVIRQEDKPPLYSPTQPALLQFVLDEYKVDKGGFQEIAATDLARSKPRSLQAELFRTETRQIGGVPVTLREWRLESPPTAEAVLWTTADNDPVYWWVPAQNFEILRRGFEPLRPSAKYENSVSPPRFETRIEKNVWVPMRDGVRLMADTYRPDDRLQHAVILQRTCYDRSEFGNADGEFFAQRGYVYVTQHVRGRGGSEGEFHTAYHEDTDGYDSVAWCASQPWSNGKVGMVGASYNGFCTWMAAKTRPKWLKTIISVVPMSGPPEGEPWAGGFHFVNNIINWYGLLRDRSKVQPYNDDQTASTNKLPIEDADIVQFGHPVPQYREEVQHERYDDHVKEASYRDSISKIDIPVLYFSGWFDSVGIGTRLDYMQMIAHGAKNQKLVWGAWDHFTNQESKVGVTDATPDAYIDMRTLTLRWFDRWLKDMPNGIEREPSVNEFMLGENRWHTANVWPPKQMKPQRWYLQESGSLAPVVPRNSRPPTFEYDPLKWVYSIEDSVSYFFAKGDDAQALCRKPGQLLFDSAPLIKPIRLDGPIRGRLYAATDRTDTDWAMSLLDVHTNGVAVPIGSGIVRARFRRSFENPSLLVPNRVYSYNLDLWQIGIEVPAGHKLRVVVGSTLFPDMDRNLNTGESLAAGTRILVAHQKIFHDPAHASYIELPLIAG